MLVGYNTNITYKGVVYHIQTEDKGIKNPFIVTLLYLKGTILASSKISYAQIASSPDYKLKVRELMKEQHRNMVRELVSGKYSSDNESETADMPAAKQAEEPGQESPDTSQISKSLDDILLDYIIKRED